MLICTGVHDFFGPQCYNRMPPQKTIYCGRGPNLSLSSPCAIPLTVHLSGKRSLVHSVVSSREVILNHRASSFESRLRSSSVRRLNHRSLHLCCPSQVVEPLRPAIYNSNSFFLFVPMIPPGSGSPVSPQYGGNIIRPTKNHPDPSLGQVSSTPPEHEELA